MGTRAPPLLIMPAKTLNSNIREFSQIGNVDVGVNVDIESHPVGQHTPQILWLVSCFKKYLH